MDNRKDLGNSGEAKAEEYLEQQGYLIIERNCRMKFGEADIIAEYDGVIYFVEVKTRRQGEFIDSYSKKQRRRLWRIAESYIARKGITKQVGFAVLGIIGNPDSDDCVIELIHDSHEP